MFIVRSKEYSSTEDTKGGNQKSKSKKDLIQWSTEKSTKN
jgi:hypothetical protein